ncbi:MAG: DUF397 domain-containing protein [Actinomycetota bacterium]|nr:DUF397 domain-containing protein [Actinomycetota bacterium]
MVDVFRDTGWFKSSASGGANDDCVEVRFIDGRDVGVRDSKNPGSAFSVTREGWTRLIDDIG